MMARQTVSFKKSTLLFRCRLETLTVVLISVWRKSSGCLAPRRDFIALTRKQCLATNMERRVLIHLIFPLIEHRFYSLCFERKPR